MAEQTPRSQPSSAAPVGDAVIVLRRGGQKSTAYGVHGSTAAAMVATAAILLG
jgi:hypothetical protein